MIKAKLKNKPIIKKTYISYLEIREIVSQLLYENDLTSVLNIILLHLEKKIPQARASILLFDEKNSCLRSGAAPSLPKEYTSKIDGLKIGPKVGSCGTAAFFKTTIVVRDTWSDPLWESFKDSVKEYDLRACWSLPILNLNGRLLGTFALYYSNPHKPIQKELIIVNELLDLVCMASNKEHSTILQNEKEEKIQREKTSILNSVKQASAVEVVKNISHEINNPLAVIQGSIYQLNRIVENEIISAEKIKLYLGRLNRSSAQIEKIVKGLHTITREVSDPLGSVSAKMIIDEALFIYQERFIENDIKFLGTGDLNMNFECRPSQLIQVLVNLLNNSFEAISKTENPWIEVKVLGYTDLVRLEITDSGDGIPESVATDIMTPLFTTKVHTKAIGLGLSVSQRLVQEISGNLWYDKSCKNTRFVVEFPTVQSLQAKQAV